MSTSQAVNKMHTLLLLIIANLIIATTTTTRTVNASYLIPTAQQLDSSSNQQQLAPSIIPFSFNQNVQEYQRAMVMCTTSSGENPVNFVWLKDDQLLTPSLAQAKQITIKWDQDALTLKIPSVRLDHAGNYTCLAKNRHGSQAYSAQLVVHGEPRWVKEPQHNEPIVKTKGQTVVIDCQTTGWPRPQQTWLIKTHLQNEFEPLVALNQVGRIALAPNGSLIIRNADKSDEANYLCKSTNGIGKGISWSTSLKVTVPAHFDQSPKQQTIIVRRQSQVQLRCDAYGDQPITIEWFKNNRPLSHPAGTDAVASGLDSSASARYSIHSNNNPLKNGLISQLLIRQTQRQDNGLFECVTRNPYGRDRLPLELVVQEEPDNIQELQATQINSRSVTLMWSEPYDGRSGISSYMFQYKKIQDVATSSVAAGAAATVALDGDGGDGTGGFTMLENELSSSSRSNQQPQQPIDGDWQHATRITLPMQMNASSPGSVKSITIEKLEPSSRYLLRALAVNSIGQSKFSQPMEFTTDEEAPEIGPINIRAVAINSTSIQVSWDEIPKSKQLGRIHGYYIGYRVASNNTAAANFVYKPYIINDLAPTTTTQQSHSATLQQQQQQRLETIIQDLRRDTVYEITVVAFNSRGSGPSSDFVVCRTIEMEAPKPVKLQIRRESNESIFIEWQRDLADQNPVDDYVLYQEKNSASQEWLQVRLPGNQTQYKAPGLKCGTRYQFYIIAQNKVGKSAPSEVVGASTSGALPVIPMKTNLIKLVNSTCLMVNLNSFQDNGCRIKTFTVRYRVDKTNQHLLQQVASSSSSNRLPSSMLLSPASLASATAAASTSATAAASTSSSTLVNSQGIGATHQALSSSMPPVSQGGKSSLAPSAGAPGGLMVAASQASQATSLLASTASGSTTTPSEWINIRPKSNMKHQRANEEDRMEYLCDLSPVGEYTIHVAASNDVGRSEIEYSINMASDELRHSALKEFMEFFNGLPNVFAYIPSMLVFVFAALSLGLVGLILYTTAIKYYQKFVIMQNQMRATRRAKADEKRRRKLANLSAARQSQSKLDRWAEEYEEEEENGDELVDGDDEEDTDDGQNSSGGSAGSRTAVMHNHHNNHNYHHQHHHHNTLGRHAMSQHNQRHQRLHQRQYSHSGGHYLSNISNSAFDTSSIDSPCNNNKFGGGGGSTCLSTASTDSIHGRFQCLNAKQYVKMNEYTMLPPSQTATVTTDLSPSIQAANEIYGSTTQAANNPIQQQLNSSTSNSPNHNNPNSLYYSTLRRTNMQTYLPQQQQQQQQQQQINRRHSQNVADQIYGGYYMAPQAQVQAAAAAAAAAAVQAQQAANEAAHSIFVPPQQIIYSAPNIRSRPPVFL